MLISVFDMFSIGIGPSSSHTVGPMRAAQYFTAEVLQRHLLSQAESIQVELFGSLAWTGEGHGTVAAILMGLEGEKPETVDPTTLPDRVATIQAEAQLHFAGQRTLPFPREALRINRRDLLPAHSNGMRFTLLAPGGETLLQSDYYSIGGGFVLSAAEADALADTVETGSEPYPFQSAAELMQQCHQNNLNIAQLMWANECAQRDKAAVWAGLLAIWEVMQTSLQRGCQTEGILPGRLQVRRRAPAIYRKLQSVTPPNQGKAEDMSRLSVYAIAVNEENAAGGRVVTAPTNGAAGIIPAVLQFTLDTMPVELHDQTVVDFLLTTAAIGILYKKNASISAAEVGCQGEVGVACSMAAAAYAAAQGGTVAQVENSAEIAMEHHLGLTCDPIAGLVQIPCIERNAMGAVQAVTAARLACLEDGEHKVSLDEVIATMRQTGQDMSTKYKETAQGGLAVNVPGC